MELNATPQFSQDLVGIEEKRKNNLSENRPIDDRPSPSMATIYDDDERLLARIGYRQVNCVALTQLTNSLMSLFVYRN